MSLLKVDNLKVHYPVTSPFGETKYVKALDGISFDVEEKQTFGIVGESGCGKSTLAKALMGLESPTAGDIYFNGKNANDLAKGERYKMIQMIFQDPYSSINPRKKAWQLIAEPLMINQQLPKKEYFDRACELMKLVGLRPELAHRYPHMFSGGQRQRIGIARALILNPKILICDEPVSALDVSIQAQVLNLLMKLQDDLGLTYLFISHDLSVVNHISDKTMVMYLGKIVEYGKRDAIFEKPVHPYTQALMASSPSLAEKDPNIKPISGELPSPLNPPTGCSFHKRCPQAKAECSQNVPFLEMKSNRAVSCPIV